MFSFSIKSLVATVIVAVIGAHAETHTVTFTNNCGFGTPTLVVGNNVLSTGAPFTINGPLVSAVAYLQTGSCGLHGEGCTVIDITLMNSGNGSTVTISPDPNNNVPVQFTYTNGCAGGGASCQDPNVGLLITFCSGPGSGPVIL